LFADSLEAVVAVSTIEELEQWRESHPRADFARFLAVAAALDLAAAGRASDRFMSYGAYAVSDTDYLFSQGLWQGKTAGLDENLIAEDISHSWLLGDETMAHPYQGQTLPDPDMSSGYSWCKAPRLDGRPVEVGALARQVVNGHPLVRELVADSGGNVRNRVIARLLELALVVPRMERWVRGFELRAPFCRHAELPDEASGAGLVEAARGSLGHWLRIEKGKISNYQIIAPTTWNFSPRDAAEQPGPLEQALQGTVVGDAAHDAVMIQHIVRSFDPCMVCTVH
ncbi:MAG: nickel-dependent hydrogenase large subunit, partial [Gammaproteobacteria bacterium]|nr:nickel-dependent hydrogenase large subunit [Gammaproteobacteria bacterium]